MSSHAASRGRRPDEHEPRVRPARAPAHPVSDAPWPLLVPPRPMRRERVRRLAVLALLVLVMAMAGAAVVMLLTSASESGQGARTKAVDLGGVSVLVPESWAAARPGAGVPILEPPAAALEPAPGLGAHAVLVLRPNAVLPDLRALIGARGQARRTTLAGLPARFYAAPAPPGDRRAELTVARTSAGVLAVVCIAPVASWVAASGCAKEISSSGPGLAPAGDPPS